MSSKITGVVAARVPNEVKEVIDTALESSDSTMRNVMVDFAKKLKGGEIMLNEGHIILLGNLGGEELPVEPEPGIDLDDFYKACELRHLEPQMAINKAAQALYGM